MRLQLADGRALDVLASGPVDGPVLMFHHGQPGSCLPIRAITDTAHRLGLRFVTTSRPGYGDSTRQPGRRVVDVVADTAAVLDLVGAERCFVAGWSGGGPHALACGARLAGRVDAVLVLAGIAPYPAEGMDWLAGMGEDNVVWVGKALEGEAALRPLEEAQREQVLQATAADLAIAWNSFLSAVDRAALTGEAGEEWIEHMREGYRVGVDGSIDDGIAFMKPWGFALAEIAVPTLLWHGTEDLLIPFSHGKWLAARIPGVVAHLEEGEGHLSIGFRKIDRILRELVSAGDRTGSQAERSTTAPTASTGN
jgi:pimeloyl-ACP methyl ester carboxylesterase